jgi:hypothetical protein
MKPFEQHRVNRLCSVTIAFTGDKEYTA